MDPDPDPDPTSNPTPFFSDFKVQKICFSYFFLITYPQAHCLVLKLNLLIRIPNTVKNKRQSKIFFKLLAWSFSKTTKYHRSMEPKLTYAIWGDGAARLLDPLPLLRIRGAVIPRQSPRLPQQTFLHYQQCYGSGSGAFLTPGSGIRDG